MTSNDEVVFDTTSGISVEEQREIFSQINGIAEKNRRLLSQSVSSAKPEINAKKSGAFFPVAFNIAAIVIMLGGAFFIVSLNGKKDAQVRTGDAVYNLTERALIEEIRRESEVKIASKDQEIEAISSRLAEVDSRLARLFSDGQILNNDQLASQRDLLALQDTYRSGLAVLREERSQILEDYRSREAALRAQLEERTRDFAVSQTRSSGEPDSAVRELDRLASEQDRITAIDAQMAGGFASVNELVQNSRFDQAAQIVEGLRQLNNNNYVSSSRSFQSRREFYSQALHSMEAMINEMRKTGGAGNGADLQQGELQERNARLEETAAQMQRTIDALNDTLNSGSTEQSLLLSQLEETVSSLRAANSSLESTVAERNRTIASLESEKTALSQTAAELRSQNESKDQEIVRLNNRLNNIQAALQE